MPPSFHANLFALAPARCFYPLPAALLWFPFSL